MNAPSINEIRGAVSRDVTDEKMDQVREILVGDTLRRMEARVAFLEGRLNDIEVSVARQLDALEARIEDLSSSTEGHRREAFEALANSIVSLGDQIRRIARE